MLGLLVRLEQSGPSVHEQLDASETADRQRLELSLDNHAFAFSLR